MGKKSRDKGKSYELEVRNQLTGIFPLANRNLSEYRAGAGYDLVNTGNLRIQCKRYAKYAPITKIEEVPNSGDTIPVLVTRGDRKKSVAVLYLDDLIKILQDIGVVYGEYGMDLDFDTIAKMKKFNGE